MPLTCPGSLTLLATGVFLCKISSNSFSRIGRKNFKSVLYGFGSTFCLGSFHNPGGKGSRITDWHGVSVTWDASAVFQQLLGGGQKPSQYRSSNVRCVAVNSSIYGRSASTRHVTTGSGVEAGSDHMCSHNLSPLRRRHHEGQLPEVSGRVKRCRLNSGRQQR